MYKINLFKNKKTKDTQPDYRGKITNDLGEVVVEAAGWMKKTKAGDDFISLTLKEKSPDPELDLPSSYDDLPF